MTGRIKAIKLLILVPVCTVSCANRNTENVSLLVYGQSNSVSPSQTIEGRPGAQIYPTSNNLTINDFYGEHRPKGSDPQGRGLAMHRPTAAEPIVSGSSWVHLAESFAATEFTIYNYGLGNSTTGRLLQDNYFYIVENLLAEKKALHVLYVQGESDCLEGVTAAESYANLKAMIVRSKKVNQDVRWFVALNGFKCAEPRAAQLAVIMEGLAELGPDVDTLRKNRDYIEPTGAEFAGDGLKRHAQLWAKTLSAREVIK